MKVLALFAAFILTGLVSTSPTSNTIDENEVLEINKELFLPVLVVYTSEHDVVSLLVPLNALNFDKDSDSKENEAKGSVLFFALADNENGTRIDQGLFIRKDGEVTKLLDNGRDAAATKDHTKTVYFGAQDGLYIYNAKENKAEQYGPITDSIMSIAKVNGSDIIYILTDDHTLYKVTEEGTKKEKIEKATNARKIVLDHQNNLFYLTSDNEVYVLDSDDVKKVEGLPETSSYVDIVKPPVVQEVGVPVIFDEQFYVAYPNSTSEITDFRFQVKPSAYSVEATVIQYYGYEKKIYKIHIMNVFSTIVSDEMKNYLESKTDAISEIATRSRSELVS